MKVDRQYIDGAAEDIEACVTEGVYNAQRTFAEMYIDIGKTILELPGSVTHNIEALANHYRLQGKKIGKTSMWFAKNLYEHYPTADDLPGGKNVSIASLKRLLAPPKAKDECEHEEFLTISFEKCLNCGKRIDSTPAK